MEKLNYKQFSCAGFYILNEDLTCILLGEDSKGFLSPQKGSVEEKDLSLFQCAVRETFEESGISPFELQYSLNEYIEYAPSGKPNILYWCCKLKNQKTEFKFNQEELKTVKWYEIKELVKSNTTNLKPQRMEILKQILIDFPFIWSDEIAQKRFLRHNNPQVIKQKNPHDKEARAIVKLLRHDLDSQKIKYDPSGYIKIQDLIKKMNNLNLDKIQAIVAYDNKYDKQRLDLKFEDHLWKIRANQGHSLKNLDDTELLTEVFEAFEYCIHGTEKRFLPSINKTGLDKMGRTHVHFISKDPKSTDFKSVISGFKKQSNCYIVVDMKASLKNGMRWFVSKNNVLLTQGPILPEFFLKIIDI